MNFKDLHDFFDFSKRTELEKCEIVSFFEKTINNKDELTANEIGIIIENAGYAKRNITRLKSNISKSKRIIKGKSPNTFRLSIIGCKELENLYPEIKVNNEVIIASDEILPDSLLSNTRGYLEKIAKQINGSYEHNFNDGCAVLMRRLIEILLILTYQHHNKQSDIQELNGDYKNLSFIINYTKSNNQFHFSKSVIECLDIFRVIGNFSAHRIEYNCLKKEIKDVSKEYRATIEELLYKSGIKK
jgi:hypothetical protein